MIARLVKISVSTAAAHIFTMVTLKFLSQRVDVEKLSSIGEIDSIFQFSISILAFGLQLSAVRTIASSDHTWKETYSETQQARNTLGFLLVPLAFLYYFKAPYALFLISPLFALSGDYALYGRSMPVLASIYAFCRVFIPSFMLIVFSLINDALLLEAYVISTASVYWITSLLISHQLHTPYWFTPKFTSLVLYLKSAWLGIVTFSFYFIGLGFIGLASSFYADDIIASAYLGIKIYVIFKGVLRIINQAFVKEMLSDEVCIKVDRLASLAGFSFALALILFPYGFNQLFFNKQATVDFDFYILLGVSALLSSTFTSLTTKSLLTGKDKPYAFYSIAAIIFSTVTLLTMSYVFPRPISFGLALVSGELIIMVGLILMNPSSGINGRYKTFLQFSLLALLPIIARLTLGDEWITMLISIGIFGFAGLYMTSRKI